MITAALAWTLSAMLLWVQTPQQSLSLSGRVRVSGRLEAIPFATVRLLRVGGEIDRQFTTTDGRFEFPKVAPGTYTLDAARAGFESSSVEFTVIGALVPELEIELKPTAGRSQGLLVSVYEAAIPKRARQEFERGLDERMRQNCAKALPHLERAIQGFPQYASAHNEMGACYVDAHDFARAESAFQRSIQFGASIYPYMNLADLYVRENRRDDARATLEEAIKKNPQEGDLYYALANTYFTDGRLQEAETAALEANSRVHRIPDLHVLLAKIYERMGNDTAVREQLREYLKEAPKSPLAAQVRQLLDSK